MRAGNMVYEGEGADFWSIFSIYFANPTAAIGEH